MLLNMVKLRYMDPPMFLDVQQVVQQYTREGSGSIFAPGWTGNSSIAPAASASGRWAESPTITYVPVSGEKFTKSLLLPELPVDLFSLVESGWPIDPVFEVGVRAVNGLHAGSRTEMLRRTGDADFYRVLSMLRELQASDSFGIRVDEFLIFPWLQICQRSDCRLAIRAARFAHFSRTPGVDNLDEFPTLPQWSGQKRPTVVRSKPANGCGPGLRCCTLPFAFRASLISEISRWRAVSFSKPEKISFVGPWLHFLEVSRSSGRAFPAGFRRDAHSAGNLVLQLRGPHLRIWPWWRRRSSIAVTAALSPSSFPQSSTGLFDVTNVLVRS
jgi:hypothetical protein